MNSIPANLEHEILKLKKERNAVILAHFYQDSEIQDIADFVGDSLDLSRQASKTNADEIIFCGVKFMAEVAKILSPQKKVLIPDFKAGCSLEDSCKPQNFAEFRKLHPNAIAITYINCSAEIKALSDIIVTSTNAKKIIEQLPRHQEIIFAPDQHLGRFIEKQTGRKMILWNGSCIVHEQFSEKELVKLIAKSPASLGNRSSRMSRSLVKIRQSHRLDFVLDRFRQEKSRFGIHCFDRTAHYSPNEKS